MTSVRTLLISSLTVLVGCGVDSTASVESNPEPISWEQFLSVVYLGEDGVYVANGDEAFEDIGKLRAFYDNHVVRPEVGSLGRDLAVYHLNGSDVKWSSSQALNLTYCVSTSFGSKYTEVVKAMTDATAAWEAAARVNFIHVSNQDSNCTNRNNNVLFDVNPVNAGGRYLARAFFPNSSRRSRNILIDWSSFRVSAPLTLTGILRHELGHTVGFRHEHTRPEAGACFEDWAWRALTSYDSGSVMHYPQCNGTGDWSLTLTTKDKAGAGALYP
ncbi:MAG: matrixin family metalloprotease [Myxococcales bacterium]|nr:matrixin family metalloprotease [Myxococcales bacterium]